MLAKTEPTPKAVEEKRRTITLTDRSPVSIIESAWPVIAEGRYDDHYDQDFPVSWLIEFKVRHGKNCQHIVHGKFSYSNDLDERAATVRVGRYLQKSTDDLEDAMLAVGNDMRDRMKAEGFESLVKYVTLALDACFAKLPVQVLFSYS